jgi:pimeloyl-ACP methyl ester carboxylesterase
MRKPLSLSFALLFTALLTLPAATPAPKYGNLYLQPGRLVDVGGYRLNLYCIGHGSPTVVFDAGLEDWAPAWITIQPVIARTTRACTYDRAGNGLSDPGPMPRTTARIVTELHTLLRNAGEKGPFILVGHSFGGINVRHYADRYLSDVAGLVLDDASAEQLLHYMTPKDQRENDESIAQAQHYMVHCEHLAQRGFRGASAKDLHKCPGMFFRGLPAPKDFPPQLDSTLVYEAERAKQYAASASEFGNFTSSGMRALLREDSAYGSIPLRILVAYHHDASPQFEAQWRTVHRQWLKLSSDSKYIAATESGHYIQFDQPQLVIQAIEEEIAIFRKHASPA